MRKTARGAKHEEMIAFGPVPSRRLGHSLGINNIPPKICTYSCVYCQVGRTLRMQVERGAFYEPEQIARNVEKKVKEAQDKGERIDYLTFVPDGEPTLDINLGKEIKPAFKNCFCILICKQVRRSPPRRFSRPRFRRTL